MAQKIMYRSEKELANCEKTKINPSLYSPLTLALVGDAVYELFIRTKLIENKNELAHSVHKKAIGFVCAKGQAISAEKILNVLTEKEMSVFKRGRNAKSPTVPKNADVAEYRCATGFEALIGYLYLSDEQERLSELMNISYKAVCEAKNK